MTVAKIKNPADASTSREQQKEYTQMQSNYNPTATAVWQAAIAANELAIPPKMELVLRQRALSSANNRQLPISHYIEYYAAFRQIVTSVDGDSFAIGQALTNNAQGGAA